VLKSLQAFVLKIQTYNSPGKIGLIKLPVYSPSCWVQPIVVTMLSRYTIYKSHLALHFSQTRVSSSPSAMRAWCGHSMSPLAENTRSTGADVASVQNTRLKRGFSKLYHGSKHSFEKQLCVTVKLGTVVPLHIIQHQDLLYDWYWLSTACRWLLTRTLWSRPRPRPRTNISENYRVIWHGTYAISLHRFKTSDS